MRISFPAAIKQAQPLVSFPEILNMGRFKARPHRKDKVKVVVVMGATGTGKSKLSIELATQFPPEIVNSDKMQVYQGLDIVTDEERRGIPHHLLGVVDPKEEFTATDFRHQASLAVQSIVRPARLPIIRGGSNSYIKALVSDDIEFQLPVLHSFVPEWVDRMVEIGLVDEITGIFYPNADHMRGIRRAIGVPEMDQFLREEPNVDDETKALMLKEAIEKSSPTLCKLACCQLENILTLQNQLEWSMHCRNATEEAFLKGGNGDGNNIWEKSVAGPSRNNFDFFDLLKRLLPQLTES